MNSMIKSTFIFTIGAAIGSVVTWKLIKTKYEQLASDEIANVKEHYSKKYSSDTDEKKEEETVKIETENREGIRIPESPKVEEDDIMAYARRLNETGYRTNYADCYGKESPEKSVTGPYVITPEDFGEHEEYDTISLYHYTDGVLADRDDDRITNFAEVVGTDYAEHIGEYEDDAVHIRNDKLKCDFEILRSAKSYEEVIANLPYDLE